MDPTGNCPYCGCTYSGDKCYDCSLKEEMSSLTDCNADSIPFLDKIEEESKAYDESADKSEKTGTDSTASAFENFSRNVLEEGEDQYDLSPSSSVTKNILLSEINPPTPINEESCMEDLLKKNCATIQRFESAPEFLSSPQADASICSSKSSPTFSQVGSPLDVLPFEPLISEDSNVWEEGKDKNVKSTDSSEKKDASSDAKVENIVQDKSKQNISRTPSNDDQCKLSMSSSLEITENQDEFEGRPSCSHADPSMSDSSERSRSKSKKSPSKDDRGRLSMSLSAESTKNQNEFESLPSCSHADPSMSVSSGHSRSKSKKSPVKHLPRKSFPCIECGKILSSKRSFSSHMFLHTKKKPFVCEDCGNAFAHKRYLKMHMRRHTGEQPYVCEWCGRAFSRKSSLVVHRRRHTGEKPYTCKTCRRSFSHKHSCIRHARRHTQ